MKIHQVGVDLFHADGRTGKQADMTEQFCEHAYQLTKRNELFSFTMFMVLDQ